MVESKVFLAMLELLIAITNEGFTEEAYLLFREDMLNCGFTPEEFDSLTVPSALKSLCQKAINILDEVKNFEENSTTN